jgi:hypothetical protein
VLLRSGDARQSHSCGAGTSGGDSLGDFGCSKRAGDPGSSHPSPGSSGRVDAPAGWVIPGKNLLAVDKFMGGKGPLSVEHKTWKNVPNLICTVLLFTIHSLNAIEICVINVFICLSFILKFKCINCVLDFC